MLIYDLSDIGNRLFRFRKRIGLTQAEIAERANLSDRAYADIERGTVNMRLETLLKICEALQITPDELLTQDNNSTDDLKQQLFNKLNQQTHRNQKTALKLLETYLNSLD